MTSLDLNFVALAGRLAAPPEFRRFEAGDALARFLVTVRSFRPRRRVDVVPVTMWNPPRAIVEHPPMVGDHLWVGGSVQRRFWSGEQGRRSRIEVVATQVIPHVGD